MEGRRGCARGSNAMAELEQHKLIYDQVAESIVEMGNRMIDEDDSVDMWEVASGMLAGAIQFWLFSRQPCDDPFCEACENISSVDLRVDTLIEESRRLAEESDYYNSPNDIYVGTA